MKKLEQKSPLRWSPLRLTTHLMAPFDLATLAIVNPINFAASHDYRKRVKKEAQVRSSGVSIPNDSLPMQVFHRLSELTKINRERLIPEIHEHSVDDSNFYTSDTHLVYLAKSNGGFLTSIANPSALTKRKDIETHELLHATQILLNTATHLGYYRQYEPTAVAVATPSRKLTGSSIIPTTMATPAFIGEIGSEHYGVAAVIGGSVAALNLLDHSRMLVVRKAVKKYGADGWIALHAQGPYDPLFAGAILHSLEKRGFLTQRGFTEKGKMWIKSLAPSIEAKLSQMEEKRTAKRI
ncbi:MAG: hypothetical protein V1722_03160 [Candidatus Micrarchaeota archaeon]